MVGEVDHGVLVGGGQVVDAQRVVVGQRVGHVRGQRAGKVLLAVLADVAKRRRDPVRHRHGCDVPDLLVERVGAAVQRVCAVVGDQVVGLAVQRELRAGDAVGVAAGDRAVMRAERLVVVQVSQAEHDVVGPSGPVGRVELGDDAAIAEEAHDEAVVVGHGVDLNRLAGFGGAVGCVLERGGGAGRVTGHRGCQCRADRGGARQGGVAFGVGAVAHDISFPSFSVGWRCP